MVTREILARSTGLSEARVQVRLLFDDTLAASFIISKSYYAMLCGVEISVLSIEGT